MDVNLGVGSVTWKLPFSQEIWDEFKELDRVQNASEQINSSGILNNVKPILIGPILPVNEKENRMAFLEISKSKEDETKELRWKLILARKPKSEPPQRVLDLNEKVSFSLGMIEKIKKTWTNSNPIAKFRIHHHVDKNKYFTNILPLNLKKELGAEILKESALQVFEISSDVYVEHIGLRFANGVNGIEGLDVVYEHEDDDFVLDISAKAVLSFGDEFWVPYIGEVIELVLGRFFKEKI